MNKINTFRFYPASIAIIFASILVLVYCASINHTFWYDEAYTMAMMKYSFSEMWTITSNDVHPPLYYYMLKLYCGVFGYSMLSMRLFSLLGVVACYLLALFPIKRLFGGKIAIVFIALLAVMPVTQYLGTEIRMYSWVMFFVLGCSVFAYKTYLSNKLIDYGISTFFAVCAAYTHHYGLATVACIFFLLGVALIRKGNSIVRLALFGSLFILALSMWVPVLIGQIQYVRDSDYWITVPNAKELLLFVYYFFSPKEPSHPYLIFSQTVMSVALLSMLVLIAILSIYLIKYRKNRILYIGHAFSAVYFVTLAITFVVTFLITPISVPRYMSCMLAPLLLGISFYTVGLYKTKAKSIILMAFSLLTLFSVARFFSEAKYYEIQNDEQETIRAYLDKEVTEPMTIISSYISYPELAELSIVFPQHNYLLFSPKDDDNSYQTFHIRPVDSIAGLKNVVLLYSDKDSTWVNINAETVHEIKLKERTIKHIKRIDRTY